MNTKRARPEASGWCYWWRSVVVVINIVQEVDEGNDKFGTFERFNSNFGVN